MGKTIKAKRASRVTIPERCHGAAKIIFAEMQRQGVTYEELSHYAGVLVSTMKAWRTNNRPGLETLEACFGALGWDFLPVPRTKHLPPELSERLEALAAEFGPQLSEFRPMLIAAAARAYLDPHFPPGEMARRALKAGHHDHHEALAA